MCPAGSGGVPASAALPLLDKGPPCRRRGAWHLPARRSERDPCHYSDRLLGSAARRLADRVLPGELRFRGLETGGADAVRELCVRVLGDVHLDALPVVLVVANAFAVAADRQQTAQLPYLVDHRPRTRASWQRWCGTARQRPTCAGCNSRSLRSGVRDRSRPAPGMRLRRTWSASSAPRRSRWSSPRRRCLRCWPSRPDRTRTTAGAAARWWPCPGT